MKVRVLPLVQNCPLGGIGRRTGFRFQRRKVWEFESPRGHQLSGLRIMDNTAVFYTVNMGSIPVGRTKLKHSKLCEYGGIGRPSGLKIRRSMRIGSTPITRTKYAHIA